MIVSVKYVVNQATLIIERSAQRTIIVGGSVLEPEHLSDILCLTWFNFSTIHIDSYVEELREQ